jgi:acylphosphatase
VSARVARHVCVRGRVQGVWFRGATREEALRRGVDGWVRNRSDGAVEGRFEGPAAAVEQLVAFCRAGPPGARVADVEVSATAPEGLSGFQIRA